MPQPGNPKKRIFRLAEDKSLINRLGFNNKGLTKVVDNLKKERDIIIGANIGKNYFTLNKMTAKRLSLYVHVDILSKPDDSANSINS